LKEITKNSDMSLLHNKAEIEELLKHFYRY